MPPQLPPESHYDPRKLGMIFAIVAVALLLSLVGVFIKDYSRQWKDYQKQFKSLEVEKTRVKLDAQQKELEKNEEYQKADKEFKAAEVTLKQQAKQQKAIENQIFAAEAIVIRHTKELQSSRADFDALKFRYESAASHGGSDANTIKEQLDRLSAKIAQQNLIVEADTAAMKVKQNALTDLQKAVKATKKKRSEFSKKADIIETKLKKIDTEQMSVANQVGDVVRDFPIIDLANPNYKINQIVLKDIPEDVNFMKVQRVDRCTTCHLGIDNPDFKNAAQPFRSHPNLELFIDKNSPHPIQEFGCTSCHMGRGRGTDFVSVAHTPRDEKQKEEWVKKYGWYEMHHWDQPMLPAPLTQAGCFKCHDNAVGLKGAEKLNLGLNLIERAGCYNCHTIKQYQGWPKTGPSLESIASKSTKEWAYHWIDDPKSIRLNTWMPSYFHQPNNSDPISTKRGQQEVHAIVEYLFAKSKPFTVPASDITGDAKNGKELVASLGCMACHQVADVHQKVTSTPESLHEQFGPNLIGLGSKTTKGWLYQWLKDPKQYHAQSRMPNMRLTDQEAGDITEYLIADQSEALQRKIPPVDEKIVNTIVMDYLKKTAPIKESQAKLDGMNLQDKLTFAGQRLIREYGCFSCHNVSGFEADKPIGVELTEEGGKNVHQLDFGFIHIEHTKEAWFKQKLLSPRIFDQGRVLDASGKLKMPNFNLSHEEAEAITMALMGFVRDRPSVAKLADQSVRANMVNEGSKTIRQFNCQSCHIIEGKGGSIQKTVTDWLVNYQGKDPNDAKAVTLSFSPPNLIGEGEKVQPQWLFDFIHEPTTIRPWLKVRMPTYGFHASQINTIVKYFNYADKQEFPFTDFYHPSMSKDELEGAEKLFSKDYFGCASCHIVGSQMPGGSADSWAPDFNISAKRLKPEWIVKWITNPAALLPGTKMPTYYDPNSFEESAPKDVLGGDAKRQIKVLRDYLLTISDHPPVVAEPTPVKKTEEKASDKGSKAPAAQSK